MQNDQIVIHTDGGARGNPGPAACAFVIEKNDNVIFKYSKFLGKQTNNHAEYQGVVLALEWVAREFPPTKMPKLSNFQFPIIFYLDSELVVKQLNGLYKIKNEALKILNEEAKRTIKENRLEVVFRHVPRERNKIADLLVNEELDKNH
jgi:ribonuclease HI